MGIGVVILCTLALFGDAAGWLKPHNLTPARFVDTFEQQNGRNPGFRRNHAKGLCVAGYFHSSGEGAALSKASVFQPGRTLVTGRFSLSGGKPFALDAPQEVRGFGLRFELADGEEWRTAMVNLPVFPVRTPEAFHELLLASAPDAATGKPDPRAMQSFLARNPQSAAALQLIQNRKVSSGFEDSTFNSLNSFRFINTAGTESPVRWTLQPSQDSTTSGNKTPQRNEANYLFDDLIAEVHRHPLCWHLIVTVGQPGDAADDASIPWPDDRKRIDVGTLTIDQVESDDTSPARDINFDPLVLPGGIAASKDPLLSARSAVYSQSFTRREGEPREPSAISPAEAKGKL